MSLSGTCMSVGSSLGKVSPPVGHNGRCIIGREASQAIGVGSDGMGDCFGVEEPRFEIQIVDVVAGLMHQGESITFSWKMIMQYLPDDSTDRRTRPRHLPIWLRLPLS